MDSTRDTLLQPTPPTRTPTRADGRVHVLYRAVHNNVARLIAECFLEWATVGTLLAVASFSDRIEPFHRVAFATDQAISYPHRPQTVPFPALVAFSFAIPLVAIIVFSLIRRNSAFRAHNAILGLCLTISFTFFLQQVVKLTAGSLRPDFLERCIPEIDTESILKRVISCNGDPKVIREGRKSFFSGHSALSFGGLSFLSMFMTQELDLSKRPLAPKYFLILLPFVTASVIAISRVDDYWHRWQDVLVGAVVGISVATISFASHCKYDTTLLRILSSDSLGAEIAAVARETNRRGSFDSNSNAGAGANVGIVPYSDANQHDNMN